MPAYPAKTLLQRAALAWVALAFAGQVGAATITGTVFEDRNYGGGAGRSLLDLRRAAARSRRPRRDLPAEQRRVHAIRDTTDASGQFSLVQRHQCQRRNGAHRPRRQRNGPLRTHRRPAAPPALACRPIAPMLRRRRDRSRSPTSVGGETPSAERRGSNTTSANFSTAQHAVAGGAVDHAGRSGGEQLDRSRASTSVSTSTPSSTRATRRAVRRPARTALSIRAREPCASSSSTPTRSAAKARSRRRAAARSTAPPRRCPPASNPASSSSRAPR